MKIGPVEAAKFIETTLGITDGPISTHELLRTIIVANGWYSGTEVADKVDFWHDRFVSRLSYQIDNTRREGGFLTYVFNSSGNTYVQGACYCEPHEPSEVIDAKRRRSHTYKIFNHCKGIGANDFEKLSGRIIKLLKVERPFVSKRSADQGIDFFGRVPIGEMLKPTLLESGPEKHMAVWIVGQSKHYPETKVSTSEIRELVGSVELARSKIFAGTENPLKDFNVRLCDPVIYMFFTTGKYTKDSKELLERSGVQSFDGLQIAQFLADHNVGISGGDFVDTEFTDWLSEPL